MSSREEEGLGMQRVDVENLDLNLNINDLNDGVFRATYGDATMDAANEMTERLRLNNDNNDNNNNNNKKSRVDADGNRIMGTARLSKFRREIQYEGSWTEQTLDLLETWVGACKKSAAAHADAARAARRRYRMISIPTIIVGTAATALSFFAAGDSCTGESGRGDSDGLEYGLAALTSLVTVLSGVNSLFNFSSKTQEHVAAAGSFSNLARRGDLQTWLPNERRGDCEVVLTDISAEFASLTTSSPLLG